MKKQYWGVISLLILSLPLIGQNRFATVDRDRIIPQMPEFKQLEKAIAQAAQKLEEKLVVFQELVEQKREKVNEARRHNHASLATLETEYQSLENELAQFVAESQATLESQRQERLKIILAKFNEAVKVVAIRRGYTHVINAGQEGISELIYYPEEEDISTAVLQQLGIPTGG
jgi:Skp family chaperone for outer membrane proteins